MNRRALRVASSVLVMAMSLAIAGSVAAVDPEDGPFERTWQRTDLPVRDGAAFRTWMWGPEAITEGFFEAYHEAHNNGRFVQYFDKSRMEINHDPGIDPDSVWYVTNGLLAKELITGEMQVGDDLFEDRVPAAINVAGDLDDPNGPTYATFSLLLNAPATGEGAPLVTRLNPAGVTTVDEDLLSLGATAARRVQVPGIDHTVASPFWDFMNSTGIVYQGGQYVQDSLFLNPFYATGYPITEAYWTTVRVGGTPHDVLLQCFERRCLTYTPDNPEGWQVEAGNVGLHYYQWRHEQEIPAYPGASGQLYAWDLASWTEDEEPDVSSVVKSGNELWLSVLTGFAELYSFVDPLTYQGDVERSIVTFDIRTLTPETVGFGCVSLRYVEDAVSYAVYLYCVDDLGALTLWYESYDFSTGEFTSDLLMPFRGSPSMNPPGEWNTLTAVMDGDRIWLLVNGDLVGYVEDDRLPAGQLALYALNFDESDPSNALTYAYRNVNVWAIN